MEWLRLRRVDTGLELVCRKDDIDYITMNANDNSACIHLKNGKMFACISDGLWDHLVPVNEKTVLNSLYGMSAARPLPDYDPEILRSEIQDLKLENDCLKKRDEIMVHFLRSVRCQGVLCDKCDLWSDHGCYWLDNPSCKDMWNMIDDVFKKLEEL